MPNLTNTLVDAAGAPVVGAAVTIELIGTWSADGAQETSRAAVWSGVTNASGVWTAALPAQSTYEGATYYLVRESLGAPSVSHACTVADAPTTQRLRDRLTVPVPPGPLSAATLDASGRVPISQLPTGTTATTVTIGNDPRLSDARAPTGPAGGALAGTYPNPGIATGAVTGTEIAPAIKDPATGTPGLRTLGTGGQQAAAGNDPRLSDARPPLAHAHPESEVIGLVADLATKVPTSRAVTSGTGLTGGGDLSADRTLAVAYGTTAGTAAPGNDARLSDARTPTAHSHPESDITGLVADLAAKAADSAVVHNTGAETVAGIKTFSSPPVVPAPGAAGNPVRNDDARLFDARTPTAHVHPESEVTGLVADLAGKAASVHTHAQADVTNLVADLASKGLKLTPTAVKVAAYTAVSGDLVRADVSGGAFAVTLPAAAAGLVIAAKKTDASALLVTLTPNGTDTIDGAASATLRLPNEVRTLVGITGGWIVASGLTTLTSLDARYAATAHAATHAAAGSDPVTPTAIGALKNTTDALEGDLKVQANGVKAYQFRTGGGSLDWNIGGAKLVVNTYPNWDFSGGNTIMMVIDNALQRVEFQKKVIWTGANPSTIDPAGDASMSNLVAVAKNGLANMRFAGRQATAGAPTTGTWATGDAILDSANTWHYCTAGGTPGTWT